MRTNVTGKSINKDFLNKLSEYVAQEFFTQVQHVTVDLQADCQMVRGGSNATMAVLQLYHNDSRCSDDTKAAYATRMAEFLANDIRIPRDRVLVLFHDTRRCS